MTAVLRLWVISPPSGFTVRAKKSAILGRSSVRGAANSQRLKSAGSRVWATEKRVIVENPGRVVFGVEADAQQLRVCQSGVSGELFVDLGEIAAHARAKFREGAARVDKGDEQDFAAILLERDVLPALVGEGEVRDSFSGCGHVQRIGGGRRRSFGMSGDFDVLDPVIRARDCRRRIPCSRVPRRWSRRA